MMTLFLNGYKWSPVASAVRDATPYLILSNYIGSRFSLGSGAILGIISATLGIISATLGIIYQVLGATLGIIWVRLWVSFKQALGATLGIISTPEERGQA